MLIDIYKKYSPIFTIYRITPSYSFRFKNKNTYGTVDYGSTIIGKGMNVRERERERERER